MSKKIAVFVGSLRKESFNKKVALTLKEMAEPSLNMDLLEIGHLEMYNQDLDETPPQSWIDFREKIKTYDGLLFVTPEYNRSIPAVLKNAIDIASRPYGKNAFDGKPGAVISVSPGAAGGFGANHHLRQALVFLNVPTLQQPEAYIGSATELFDPEGKLVNDSTRKFLHKFIDAYGSWVNQHRNRS